MIKLAVLTSMSALVIGCANAPDAMPIDFQPEAWASRVDIRRDDFERTTTIKGADLNDNGQTAFLRSTRSDALPNEDGLVLYVIARMDEWKFIDRAFTNDGQSWPLTAITRDVRGCSRYGCSLVEHVAVHLPRSYLATKTDRGFEVKLAGKRGDQFTYIPGNYVQGFLMQLPALPKPPH